MVSFKFQVHLIMKSFRQIKPLMETNMFRFSLIALLISIGAKALRDSSHLVPSCYSFPDTDFSLENCIKCSFGFSPKLLVNEGDEAIDFTLKDSKV